MEMGIQKHQLYLVSLENRVYFHVNGNSQIESMDLYAQRIVYMHTSTYLTKIHFAGSIKLIQGLKSNWVSISILCIQMQCHPIGGLQVQLQHSKPDGGRTGIIDIDICNEGGL